MRVPIRKKETYVRPKLDPHITAAKFQELTAKLDRMKNIIRPREAEEVKRLALMGDFSENAGYQLAKGRLRGLNQRILETEEILKFAEIIEDDGDNSVVRLGHLVTVEVNGQVKSYRILGSTETNPTSGVISHNSPLGSALLGKAVGDTVSVQLTDRAVGYKIVKIA